MKSVLAFYTFRGLSFAADRMQYIVLYSQAYELYPSPRVTAEIGMLLTVPAMIAGPIGGFLVDRLPQRSILFVLTAVWGLATAVLLIWPAYGALLALACVSSVVGAIRSTASQAILTNLVDSGELVKANSVVEILQRVAQISLPAVTGWGLGFGLAPVVAAQSGLLLLATLSTTMLRSGQSVATEEKAQVKQGNILGDLPWLEVGMGFAVAIGSGLHNAAVVDFIRGDLGLNQAGYGLLVSAIGAGQLAGALVSRWFRSGRKGLPWAFLATGASFSIFGLTHSLASAFVARAIVGISIACFNLWLLATLQQSTPGSIRGRVLAFYYTLQDLMLTGGTFVGGFGATALHISSRLTIILVGPIVVALGALGRVRRPKHGRPSSV